MFFSSMSELHRTRFSLVIYLASTSLCNTKLTKQGSKILISSVFIYASLRVSLVFIFYQGL